MFITLQWNLHQTICLILTKVYSLEVKLYSMGTSEIFIYRGIKYRGSVSGVSINNNERSLDYKIVVRVCR